MDLKLLFENVHLFSSSGSMESSEFIWFSARNAVKNYHLWNKQMFRRICSGHKIAVEGRDRVEILKTYHNGIVRWDAGTTRCILGHRL